MSTYEANRYAFPASAIASGTLADARIPNLATSKITSGTFDDARLSSSSVTQHVDLSNLNASNLTSGSIPNARVPSGAVTQHVSAVTQQTGNWTPSAVIGGFSTIYATYSRTGNIVTVVANFRYNGSGRTNSNNSAYYMSGLPFTSRNASGQHHVGSGTWSFYNSRGLSGIVRVPSNSSQMYFYSHGANITTSTYYSGGGSDEIQYPLASPGDNGYRITRKNMYKTMETNRWGHLFLVYQV
tara:strand:- start:22 stop:744 length:723 start_codon:yes stop_codon:yes gene_type:complete